MNDMPTETNQPGMTATLAANIARLRAREAAEAENAGLGTRLADRITCFTGSMTFVAIHLILYGVWIAVNVGAVPGLPRFDPSFVILAMEASVEAIFLSTFVLISQNRMAAAASRRADLDLHINLLAEHELTKLAALVERIAARMGLEEGHDFHEITKDVRPEAVLDALEEDRSGSSA